MAEEEEKPAPNVVGSFAVPVKAPMDFVWKFLKDSGEFPRTYEPTVVTSKSLGRERTTRKCLSRETRIKGPKLFFRHTLQYDEPVECDKPLPPPPEAEEGEEEVPEGEEPPPPPEPPVPERWMRCALVWNISLMGVESADLQPCEGTITFQCTCAPGEENVCDLEIKSEVYSETVGDKDMKKWAETEALAYKALAEKVIYLSPGLLKKYTRPLHDQVLKKAKSFTFIPTKLSKSPSAASLIEERKMTGSVNFYMGEGRGALSPSPLPRTTSSVRGLVHKAF